MQIRLQAARSRLGRRGRQGPATRAWATGGSRWNQIPGQGSPLQGWRRARGGDSSRAAALGGAPVFSLNCWRGSPTPSAKCPESSARAPPHPSSSSKTARSFLNSAPGSPPSRCLTLARPAPETTRVNVPLAFTQDSAQVSSPPGSLP